VATEFGVLGTHVFKESEHIVVSLFLDLGVNIAFFLVGLVRRVDNLEPLFDVLHEICKIPMLTPRYRKRLTTMCSDSIKT
jgi:hypothetical protein